MSRLTTWLMPLPVVIGALFTTAPACSQDGTPQQSWSQELKKEEERLRLEVDRLNQEFQREALELERNENYRQGQEHLRKTLMNRAPTARP